LSCPHTNFTLETFRKGNEIDGYTFLVTTQRPVTVRKNLVAEIEHHFRRTTSPFVMKVPFPKASMEPLNFGLASTAVALAETST
jgi:hypothetical protein